MEFHTNKFNFLVTPIRSYQTAYAVSLLTNNEGFLWDPPRVPKYYNFAWVPHTFGGLTPPDTIISHTARHSHSKFNMSI